jgi:hypothetical protein
MGKKITLVTIFHRILPVHSFIHEQQYHYYVLQFYYRTLFIGVLHILLFPSNFTDLIYTYFRESYRYLLFMSIRETYFATTYKRRENNVIISRDDQTNSMKAESSWRIVAHLAKKFPPFVELSLCGLVVRGPGFDSRHYQIFWEVVCLERWGATWKESSGSGLENRN